MRMNTVMNIRETTKKKTSGQQMAKGFQEHAHVGKGQSLFHFEK
jgi:hypothetical protein